MSEERWNTIRELFHGALDLPPASRSAFLNSACTDAGIRVEVESLLENADGTLLDSAAVEGVRGAIEAAMIDQSAGPNDGRTATEPSVSGAEGMWIGRYRLLEKIGEGGMGEVWRAEQVEPIRRQIAIKLVKASKNTRDVMARFESERQTLALMDHPAIAKVFDAGATSEGAPYFVMEYVFGAPITAFCDSRQMTTRERLELFVRVCEGVQHAHQKAIIHRDLKPSNILVTEVDGKPAPKIIDFGVAKALAQKPGGESLLTREGSIVGTLEYMSPEQAASSGEDIDTRTDVYALGIILYELLVGMRPIELRTTTLEEFLRKLREEEPEKPSTAIRREDEATSTKIALNRQNVPAALAKEMRGDLDAITLKTLDKDRSRRYDSPSSLAADIGRYLRNEGVLAVPASAAYRARKFARRHRWKLMVAAAIALVLIATSGFAIRQSLRANREAAATQALNDFLLKDLLAQAGSTAQSGPQVKADPHLEVRTALDRAARRIEGKFGRQPDLEAAIRSTVGETYIDLGLYPEARAQLERVLELYGRTLGAQDPKTLKAMSRVGAAAWSQGEYPRAEALFQEALAGQRRVLGASHPDTLYSMNSVATAYLLGGKLGQAEALYEECLTIRRRVLGPEHRSTLITMSNLAGLYYMQGKYAQAESALRDLLQRERHVLGSDHPDTLAVLDTLADAYQAQGKYPDAEALHSEALESRRRILGPEHPETLVSMQNLGIVYDSEGKFAVAEAMNANTLRIRQRVLGPEHPDTVFSRNNLADDYFGEGRFAEAAALYTRSLEIGRRVWGSDHPYTPIVLSGLATLHQMQGRYGLAESFAREALNQRRRTLGPGHPDTMTSAADLSLACLSEGKLAESEALAREAFDFYRQKQPDLWQGFRAESLFGASLSGQKRYAEAERFLVEGVHGMVERKDRIPASERIQIDRARGWTAQLYLAWGQPQKAAEWKKK